MHKALKMKEEWCDIAELKENLAMVSINRKKKRKGINTSNFLLTRVASCPRC